MYSHTVSDVELLDRTMGVVLGTAVADALGRVFEQLSPGEVKAIVGADEKVDRYYPSDVNPKLQFDTKELGLGQWTDDMQLTRATLRAITRGAGEIKMDLIVEEHVAELERSRARGWGKATFLSVERLKKDPNSAVSGEKDANGAGVLMKASAIGLWHAIPWPEADNRLDSNTEYQASQTIIHEMLPFARMTHYGIEAFVAAVVHAYAVSGIARGAFMSHWYDGLIDALIALAKVCHHSLGVPDSETHEVLCLLRDSNRSSKIRGADAIGATFKSGSFASCLAYNVLGAAYASIRSAYGYGDIVSETILAGGDTDTSAAVAAQLICAESGSKAVPTVLLSGLEARREIIDEAFMFYRACVAARR